MAHDGVAAPARGLIDPRSNQPLDRRGTRPAARGAVCVAEAGACPPEDCGGLEGYYDQPESLADPEHADHPEMKGRAGGLIDPAHFDLAAVNRDLSRCRV